MASQGNNEWVYLSLLSAASIVVSEVGKVELSNYYRANLKETSLRELLVAGVVSAVGLSRLPSQRKESGAVPWLVIAAMAAFKVQWSIWRDRGMDLAPNAGVAKQLVNLNGAIALLVGWGLLGQKLNRNMVLGTVLSTLGSYVSTL